MREREHLARPDLHLAPLADRLRGEVGAEGAGRGRGAASAGKITGKVRFQEPATGSVSSVALQATGAAAGAADR